MIMGAVESQICRAPLSWRPRKELMLPFKSKMVWRQNFLFLEGTSIFHYTPSTDYTRPTHIVEGNRLCSVSNDLNVNSYQRSNLMEISRVVFD